MISSTVVVVVVVVVKNWTICYNTQCFIGIGHNNGLSMYYLVVTLLIDQL